MKMPRLAELSIGNLSEDQKRLVQEYHAIQHTLATSPEDEIEQLERLAEIWQFAEDDLELCDWLEFIDSFHDEAEYDDLVEGDRRAYLGEYISLLAKGNLRKGFIEPANACSSETPMLVLICPDGSGYYTVPIQESMSLEELEDQICNQCNAKLADHKHLVSVLPKA